MGRGEPLVLLHGVMGSERMWEDVAPLLESEYQVIAPTAYGHCGGEAPTERPARYRDVVAGAERQLDRLSLSRAHLVGNSMGGWMALDLARRGRALSVFAISPAGMWPAPTPGGKRPRASQLIRGLKLGRITRPAMPLLYRSASLRQFAFRDVIAHGARLSRELALALTDDMLGCEIADDLLETDEYLAPLDPPPCPITIAWAQWDRIFPERVFGPQARERVPGARYITLPKVGHVAMLDDHALVADAIRESLRALPRRTTLPDEPEQTVAHTPQPAERS
jgi:pimeloyl-ACP methyl ester carboxylesterase